MSNRQIGLIGSMHFVGWVLSLPVVPVLADRYGRKQITCVGVVLQLIATLGILFSTQLELLFGWVFLMGLAMSFRLTVGFVWMQELIPSEWKVASCTLFSVLQSMTAIGCSLYFMYISNDYIGYFSLSLICITLSLSLYFFPESPIYLL